mmetsp:Transcript_52432/g.111729  ORF Transcript_52432/g.111729 Transcript_52432/m.111729 type:complete len:320 (+) Transcript_52432:315-1274(+)
MAVNTATTPGAPDLRPAPVILPKWYEENKALFSPPICNKLMHKDQLTIMFVGGPNTRTDFHLDLGSEFFYQLEGNMSLPTIQQGKRKVVDIKEGQVFLLPSRVPHSPQRPEEGALGLVVERRREPFEKDGLRWYRNFEECSEVLYERYFHCADLGRDLVPVVQAYKASEEFQSGVPKEGSIPSEKPFEVDSETEVPDPFVLEDFLEAHKAELAAGGDLNLFKGHPDGETTVRVQGGVSEHSETSPYETFLYQLKGQSSILIEGRNGEVELEEQSCFIVDANTKYTIKRKEGSIGLLVRQDPTGNRAATEPEAKRAKNGA